MLAQARITFVQTLGNITFVPIKEGKYPLQPPLPHKFGRRQIRSLLVLLVSL